MKFISYFRESYEELRKVVWPTREIVIKHTIIVIISVGIAMVLIGAIDYGLTKLVALLINR